MALLCSTELSGHRAGCARGDSPVPGEEKHSWAQLLGSLPSSGHQSSSSSICTEDFAAKFWEGMVEPLLCQQEPAGHVPMEGAHPGQDESLFPTGRSLDTGTELAMELNKRPWQDRSPSQRRRESLESLGARISRLSQSHVGVSWGVPWASPSAQPALGCRDSPHGDLVATALPEHSWRTPGVSAGRSRAGTSTGSSFPRATSARTRGHPALDMRRQEPPALWGRGGNVTFSMDDTDRTQAADSSKRGATTLEEPGDTRAGICCQALEPKGQGQRLRELERGSRSLLQQRLRVMQQLRGLLQRDEAETLRQLQEALEQVREGRRGRGNVMELLGHTQPQSRERDPAGHRSPDVLLL
ncbi:hypothetical protein TURU_138559 [Turdus rufiventris]|nr:hypothetical protein TURU_138559 [Turdus rufiventris]